jgi:hypothetical protein
MSEQEPKQKNDQPQEPKTKRKNDRVEWSFDFANFSEGFNRFISSLAGDEEVNHSSYNVAQENSRSARIDLGFSLGACSLRALAPNSPNLFEAEVDHVGTLDFEATGHEVKTIELKQSEPKVGAGPLRQGLRALASSKDLKWDVAVSPDLPLALDVDGGVGNVTLNLTGLTITQLDVDTGVGRMDMDLPAQEKPYTVELDSGVGQTIVNIPDGADVRLDIDGGVGTTEINIPPNVAVQIKADTGIGSVSVPAEFERVSGKNDFMDNGGVWQTAGFELAQRRIVIRYDGGVGQFRVRYAEVV